MPLPPHSVRLKGRHWLAEDTVEMTLTRPDRFAFLPGQYIRIHHHGIERDYSLISAPDAPDLQLCIRCIPGGRLTPRLRDMPIGTELQITGPGGYFLFRASDAAPVFVASGTGIAPFVSMCRSGVTGFILFHGVRYPNQLYYADMLRPAAARYIACISGPEPGPSGAYPDRVPAAVEDRLSKGPYDFYVCGRAEMIRDVTRIVDRRFPAARLFTERFF